MDEFQRSKKALSACKLQGEQEAATAHEKTQQLAKILEQLRQDTANKKAKRVALENQLATAQKLVKERDALKESRETTRQERLQLAQKEKELEAAIAAKRDSILSFNQSIAKKQLELATQKGRKEKNDTILTKNVLPLKAELVKIEARRAEVDQQLKHLFRDVELSRLDVEMSSEKGKLAQLDQKIQELEAEITNNKSFLVEIDQKKKAMDVDFHDKFAALRKNINQVGIEVAALEDRRQDQERRIREKKSKILHVELARKHYVLRKGVQLLKKAATEERAIEHE